jgi:fucose 4-O-acetylase-like acetyltransferase
MDTLRGFTMFFVVLGHILYGMSLTEGSESVLYNIALTFRMPTFFFVSGFFAYRPPECWNKVLIKDILQRKVQAQIFCPMLFYALWAYLNDVNVFGWTTKGWGLYWFTIVLFQIFLLYLILLLLSKRSRHKMALDFSLIMASVLLLSLLVCCKGELLHYQRFHWISLSKYFQFFALGVLFRKHYVRVMDILKKDSVVTLIILTYTALLLLYFNDGFKVGQPLLYQSVHDVFVRYAGLLTVFVFFSKSKNWLERDNFITNSLCLIGQRTLDIYMIHYFLLPNLLPLKPYFMSGNTFIFQIFIFGLIALMVIAVCLLISQILRSSQYLSFFLLGTRLKTGLRK